MEATCLFDTFHGSPIPHEASGEQFLLGESHENPYFHVRDFEQLCSTQGNTGATQDVLRRNLFPFSLSGGVRTWYRCFGHDHHNWEH
jgi:hypothetical protein